MLLHAQLFFNCFLFPEEVHLLLFKGTIMKVIEKALANDRLRVSKVSLKFCIPTIYNFAVVYP